MAGTKETITMMVDTTDIDEKILYERAEMLLKSYRFICWKTAKRADELRDTLTSDFDYCSTDLNSALVYLENFAPDREKDQFARRIKNLFEVKWVTEIVDAAIMKVREYPDQGELYASILSVYYLSRFKFNVDANFLRYDNANTIQLISVFRCNMYCIEVLFNRMPHFHKKIPRRAFCFCTKEKIPHC